MGGTRRFTILHSNDMHGDFFAEVAEGKTELIGGLALLFASRKSTSSTSSAATCSRAR